MIDKKIWQRIALIDVEASGLMKGSFPVEVAWDIDGLSVKDMIINPDGVWDVSRWDADAEAMHGLPLSSLRREGRHPRIVAGRLNAAFSGRIVLSDSPTHDEKWLTQLHSITGVSKSYQVESVGKLLGFLGLKEDRAYEIFEAARDSHPPRGRAREGVLHLREVVEQSLNEVRP